MSISFYIRTDRPTKEIESPFSMMIDAEKDAGPCLPLSSEAEIASRSTFEVSYVEATKAYKESANDCACTFESRVQGEA